MQPAFQAVVDALHAAVSGPLGDLVDSAYLYGSVARGDAVVGRSDLDAMLLLARTPSADALEQLGEVVKIDFDLGSLGQVQAPRPSRVRVFWLKHHCRYLAGPDRAARPQSLILANFTSSAYFLPSL